MHHREAVRHDARRGEGAQRARARRLRREPGLPHRPLPGQGDRPEHAGVPLRQRAVRAASGTATTSTTCRSRRPRTSASARAPATTTTPARCATSCRTTCSSCSATLAMEPPVDFSADEVRDEKVKVLHAIRAPTPEDVDEMAVRAQYARGHGRRRGRARLPRGGGRPGGLQHRDLRGAAPGGRQLALGRRAVLPAHRQAPGAQGHRDRRDAQAGAPPRASSRRARSACSPTSSILTHAAQRGRVALARREDPRHADAHPAGEHGVPLRHRVHVAVAGGLRAADHRRDARRRHALHPQRRGRGAVARSATRSSQQWEADARAAAAVRGRHARAPTRPTSCCAPTTRWRAI